ncbi:MAG: endonuclease III [Patescibacteria group bacterium]
MDRFRKYTKPWITRESQKAKKERAQKILSRLKKTYPKAAIALIFKTDFQLLVAVILSAQCTDKKVNEVTSKLFMKLKTPRDFAQASQRELEKLIYQTGFYRAKARHIIETARIIERDFKGQVPRTMPEMLLLHGVARKTANVVLGNAHGVVDGIAVDTHVGRISQRLGLVETDKPEKIEQELMLLFSKKEWLRLTYYIIEHGRALCKAPQPLCESCPLYALCPSAKDT